MKLDFFSCICLVENARKRARMDTHGAVRFQKLSSIRFTSERRFRHRFLFQVRAIQTILVRSTFPPLGGQYFTMIINLIMISERPHFD